MCAWKNNRRHIDSHLPIIMLTEGVGLQSRFLWISLCLSATLCSFLLYLLQTGMLRRKRAIIAKAKVTGIVHVTGFGKWNISSFNQASIGSDPNPLQ